MSADDRHDTGGNANGVGQWASRLIALFRVVAVVLVLFGFSGWVIDDGGTVSLESPFTIAFGVGVACAIVSIYLGVFLANRGE